MSIQNTKQELHGIIDSIDSMQLLQDIYDMLTCKEVREATSRGCTGEELRKIMEEKLKKN